MHTVFYCVKETKNTEPPEVWCCWNISRLLSFLRDKCCFFQDHTGRLSGEFIYINIYTIGHSKISAHRDVPVCPACSFSVDAVLIFKFLLFAVDPGNTNHFTEGHGDLHKE